uniref:Pyroglutamyl-peptidase I like n=1 Tax=Electrophorus electricus TaxID=8005 RepID=A0A4W4HAY1_ELEEL
QSFFFNDICSEFGPFRQCLVNPSWEGWKITGLGEGIEAQTAEIPVSYAKAQQILAEIWQNMKPKVAVHLGIAPGTKCIILEQTAKNHDYKDRDVCGFCPAGNFCIEGGAEQLDSIISMRSLANSPLGFTSKARVCNMSSAHRYLCDFVYYCSLYYGQRRAALIHVPVSGSLAHPDRLVPQLQAIILALLQQLDKHSSSPTKSTCSAG